MILPAVLVTSLGTQVCILTQSEEIELYSQQLPLLNVSCPLHHAHQQAFNICLRKLFQKYCIKCLLAMCMTN